MTDTPRKPEALPEPSPVEHGGRVELRLLQISEEQTSSTRYQARWFTSDQKIDGQVEIGPGDRPNVTVSPDGELPEWLGTFTVTLVRTTARTAKKENNWPRRLTRWRAAPVEKK